MQEIIPCNFEQKSRFSQAVFKTAFVLLDC